MRCAAGLRKFGQDQRTGDWSTARANGLDGRHRHDLRSGFSGEQSRIKISLHRQRRPSCHTGQSQHVSIRCAMQDSGLDARCPPPTERVPSIGNAFQVLGHPLSAQQSSIPSRLYDACPGDRSRGDARWWLYKALTCACLTPQASRPTTIILAQTLRRASTFAISNIKMVKVTLNGEILAESDSTVVVEGNHYFPPDSITKSLFSDSDASSVCPWKGTASYYNATVSGKEVKDVAWYYPTTKEKANNIKGYIAFYKNKVDIQ